MDRILPSEGRDIGSIPILDTIEYVKSNEMFGFFLSNFTIVLFVNLDLVNWYLLQYKYKIVWEVKKMKKSFIFFILFLLIPFFVKAEVCDVDKISINSIEIEEKSKNTQEL